MSAEFLSGGERLLEIGAGAFFERAAARTEGSLANGFAGKIGGKAIFVYGDDRKAAAVYSDAVGDLQLGGKRGRVNSDAASFAMERQRFHSAKVLYDSGKHCDIEDSILAGKGDLSTEDSQKWPFHVSFAVYALEVGLDGHVRAELLHANIWQRRLAWGGHVCEGNPCLSGKFRSVEEH